jgi:methylmalonyl-CoA carboxyltransferase 5S subunit
VPRNIDITELALRDAHQSLIATRMALEDMVPSCPTLDKAGFWSLECWGGATYDACIRFLNEDPWERLRTFRELLPNSRTQMLLRGQNLLGYRHYADDVVDKFVDRAAANGMDVFRIFDALNDIRNLRRAIKATVESGKHAQGTICYTISPVHDIQGYVDMAEELMDLGCHSLALKDMAALLKPQPTYDIVKAIKKRCGESTRVHVHVHSTTGVTLVSLMKAIEAGADVVDSALGAMSLGPGHNPTQSLIEMLEDTGYTTSVDLDAVLEANAYFADVMPRYKRFMSAFTVDTEIFHSQIPGGMISNMESQLKGQGAGDRLRDVLKETPNVRRDAGFPPLVTPTSQIVGTQAVLNVLMGRYKTLTTEFADLMLGYYGKTAAEKDAAIVAQAQEQTGKQPIEGRPADELPNEWDVLRSKAAELEGFNDTDEDVLTYALFPQVAPKFFRTRPDGPINPSKEPLEESAPGDAGKSLKAPASFKISVGGQTQSVRVEPAE